MLKSCQYCGKIHDSKYICEKKPKRKKKDTEAEKFRSGKAWQRKREEIKGRDNHMCQLCIRDMYMSMQSGSRTRHRRLEYDNLSVHHMIPIEIDFNKRLDNDNLITLCNEHHRIAEEGAIPYKILKEIVEEIERGENEREIYI